MIRKQTTFILGAGASVPYGFPTGLKLTEEIFNNLREIKNSKDKVQSTQLAKLVYSSFTYNDIVDFYRLFLGAGAESIDSFLEQRTEFIQLGKILIAYNILEHENQILDSTSNFLPGFENKDHWYRYLWQFLKAEATLDTFKGNRLIIVTFNYDRSFEYYFQLVISNLFRIPLEAAFEMLQESIKIIHLHGSVGNLYNIKEPNFVPFGMPNFNEQHHCRFE